MIKNTLFTRQSNLHWKPCLTQRRSIMLFTERYSKQISGVLHCYDRVIIQGTVPGICYAGGMTSYLYCNKIRIFDYPKFAAPFKEKLRNNAEKIASNHGIKIRFLPKRNIRKEKIIKNIIELNRCAAAPSPNFSIIFSIFNPNKFIL